MAVGVDHVVAERAHVVSSLRPERKTPRASGPSLQVVERALEVVERVAVA